MNEVVRNKNLRLDVFAYDLNEPDLIDILVKLAKQGRARIILDNAALHHSASSPKPEDQFEKLFNKAAGKKTLLKRGKFGRYAHDKVFIVSNKGGPTKVMTGSTNFSVTGLYVNSNHVLIFDTPAVVAAYAGVFEDCWNGDVKKGSFLKSKWSSAVVSSKKAPPTEITFSPHDPTVAQTVLDNVVKRIAQEGKKAKSVGSVLFAVMQIDKGVSPVFKVLNQLHKRQDIFSYGISDSPAGIALYPVGAKTGVLVTGKPVNTQLPPPFNQVPNIGGVGHQVHHKFVVCGFNGPDPVVYCGSSNLALGGEKENGDNLLAISDGDVATVFAIEALGLIDHFDFLDHAAKGSNSKKPKAPALPQQAAVQAGWFLSRPTTSGRKSISIPKISIAWTGSFSGDLRPRASGGSGSSEQISRTHTGRPCAVARPRLRNCESRRGAARPGGILLAIYIGPLAAPSACESGTSAVPPTARLSLARKRLILRRHQRPSSRSRAATPQALSS